MDDDDARNGGSVPDPDDRLWRHPSELAAGAGTAPIGRIDAGGLGVGSKAVAAIAVAAGAIYLSWYLTASTSGQSVLNRSATQAVSATTVTAIPTTSAVGAASLEPVAGLNQDEKTASSADEPTAPLPSDPESPDGAPPTPGIGPLDDDDLISYSGEPVAPLLKSLNQALVEQRQVGLYESRTGREPLARFIAHDGMLVTSASALDGRSGLSVWDMNDWVAASVVGIDRITDIAVLEPESWTEQLDALALTVDAGPAPLRPNQTVAIKPTTMLTGPGHGQVDQRTEDDATVGTGGDTNSDADGTIELETGGNTEAGAVVGVEERVPHRGGHAIYDGARTTIEFRSSLAGGRLLDDRHRTVGMVVNTNSWSLAAMPIESALDIARSLGTAGQAVTGWIGLEAVNDDNGARVVWVEPGSPSAELVSRGDVVETWNGEPVLDADHLVHFVRRTTADRPVTVGIRRDGRPKKTTLIPAPTTVND